MWPDWPTEETLENMHHICSRFVFFFISIQNYVFGMFFKTFLNLQAGFIRHTVNKITFSEQCYYVAGDGLCAGLNALRLRARSPSADSDTVPPLPNPR